MRLMLLAALAVRSVRLALERGGNELGAMIAKGQAA
jgi:hypothetical protein